MFAWILVKTYGPIDQMTAKQILQLQGLSELYMNPDFKVFARNLRASSPKERLRNILFTCFEFIKEAVMRWKSVYGREYLASQRRIRFLEGVQRIV